MVAKKAATSGPSLAVGLKQVQPALAAWRQRRRHRERIPDNLWGLIVPLARAHGVSAVAQALGLNYTALKQRTVTGGGVGPGLGNRVDNFVEVPVASWPGGAPWSLELEDRRGLKLTVRLARGETTTVLALTQGLWRQRS